MPRLQLHVLGPDLIEPLQPLSLVQHLHGRAGSQRHAVSYTPQLVREELVKTTSRTSTLKVRLLFAKTPRHDRASFLAREANRGCRRSVFAEYRDKLRSGRRTTTVRTPSSGPRRYWGRPGVYSLDLRPRFHLTFFGASTLVLPRILFRASTKRRARSRNAMRVLPPLLHRRS